MAVRKTNPTYPASAVPQELPDLPHISAQLLEVPGMLEYNQKLQRWWDQFRRNSVFITDRTDAKVREVTATATNGLSVLTARIQTEEIVRANADSALASRTSSLEASVDDPTTGLLARVSTIESAYVDSTGAYAQAVSAITAELTGPTGSIYASVKSEETARVNADSALALRADALEASVDTPTTGLLARVSTIESAYVDASGAYAQAVSAISTELAGPTGSIYAAVDSEATARSNADGALASLITTVEAKSVGRGAALNSDPGINDTSIWDPTNSPTRVTDADFLGGYAWEADANSVRIFSESVPISPGRTYRLTIRAKGSGGNRTGYLTAQFRDETGAVISGASDPQGWPSTGTYHYYGITGSTFPTTATDYSITFGPGQTAGIPSNARYIRLGALLGFSGTTGWNRIGSIVLEEVTSALAYVSAEASARATADGHLSGKYTLTVAAGNVVTGMNITSASGAGSNISEVTFQADRFTIYNGSTGLAPFQIVGSKVRFTSNVEIDGSLIVAGTLTVNYSDIGGTKPASNADNTEGKLQTGTTITGGGITLSAGGSIKGGASNFSTGVGWFLGYEGGQYKFRVGDPSGAHIEWDGSSWTVVGWPGGAAPEYTLELQNSASTNPLYIPTADGEVGGDDFVVGKRVHIIAPATTEPGSLNFTHWSGVASAINALDNPADRDTYVTLIGDMTLIANYS